MNDDIEEKLKEVNDVISNIPDGVISAMQEIGFDDKIRLMAFDNKLTVEESGRFHDLVEGYILGGYEDEEFSKKLTEIVRDPNQITKIGSELNEKILLPLRKQLVEGEFDSMDRNGDFDESDNSTPKAGDTPKNDLEINKAPFSIIGNNLSASSINTTKESDYSIPKITEGSKKDDPYLEPLDDVSK